MINALKEQTATNLLQVELSRFGIRVPQGVDKQRQFGLFAPHPAIDLVVEKKVNR